jgi:hypothetical protein
MSESPEARWPNPKHSPSIRPRRLPPTPQQRRMGTRIGIGVILLILFVIVLLDRLGIIH